VKTYFHTDKMGSVVAMSKSDGTLAEGPYTYDPYGNCVGGGSSCGAGEPYLHRPAPRSRDRALLLPRAILLDGVRARRPPPPALEQASICAHRRDCGAMGILGQTERLASPSSTFCSRTGRSPLLHSFAEWTTR